METEIELNEIEKIKFEVITLYIDRISKIRNSDIKPFQKMVIGLLNIDDRKYLVTGLDLLKTVSNLMMICQKDNINSLFMVKGFIK